MNAVTSVARDTADPEVRWPLEEMGGGICAGLTAVLEPEDGVGQIAATEPSPRRNVVRVG
jgi:hypothetical protein